MTNQPKNTSGAKPAVPHKKNFLDDRRIRLALSILGAIVAWMIVTIIVQPGTTNTIYNVPVDYTYDSSVYTSRGLSIVSAEDKTVNLKISGDGYTIGSLPASDFVVYPDWSRVRDSGEKTLRLLVRGLRVSPARDGLIWMRRSVTSLCTVLLLIPNFFAVCRTVAFVSIM